MTNAKSSNFKTVYILGAGFSYEAGFPLQAQILSSIFKYPQEHLGIMSGKDKTDFLRFLDRLVPAIDSLKSFIADIFPSKNPPSLEDLFTLLDQTISQRGYCHQYDWKKLDEIRDKLNLAILVVFHDAVDQLVRKSGDEFYKLLGCFLINERLLDKQFSIISLNWDSVIEECVYWCLKKIGGLRKADIDYCCYTSPIGQHCVHTPSILQKAKGIKNIKLLKMHGSANWIRCPNCNRLYTGIGSSDSVWNLYVFPRACHHCCDVEKKENTLTTNVEPFFISPTYLKVFNNAHIQMTWYNAHVELQEADKVVFVGYSLPEADYHLRTLLRRSIRRTAKIEVVLVASDQAPKKLFQSCGRFYASKRYEDFFGYTKVRFYWGGTKNYFFSKFGTKKIQTSLGRLKQKINHLKRKTS